MSDTHPLREKIKANQPVVGSWMQIPHSMVGEVLAQSALDFILIDGEHAPMPAHTLVEILPGIEKHEMATIYRVASNRPEYIKAALDSGATGVMVPMVNTAQEAAAAVKAAKYAPAGQRGLGSWRVSNYYRNENAYRASANESNLVIVQIETVEALHNIDAIAATPGVDVIYIGPGDLAMSMGTVPGEFDEQQRRACDLVASAAKRNGIASGTDVPRKAYLQHYVSRGMTFFTHGLVASFIFKGAMQAAQDLQEAITHTSR